LGARLARREPLCEDTDWECPLGPFRDTSVVRGTLGELCQARLTDLSFGLGVVVHELLPAAEPALAADVSAHAVDDAHARAMVVDALAVAVQGPLRTRPLAGLLAARQPT
jgi:hypothetical protein